MPSRKNTSSDDNNESGEEDKLTDSMEMKNKHRSHSNGASSSTNRFIVHYEKILKDRHHRVEALLLLIIFILSITLIAIGIKVLIHSMQRDEDVCENSDCLFSAARFSKKINSSTNPCDNFYEYACGNWISDHRLDEYQGSYTVDDGIKDDIYLELKHYLDKIITLPPDDPFTKTKKFYDSCMNLEEIDISSLNYIKHEIVETGGWNIIGNWYGPNWKHDTVLERLQTYYGVNAFFKISIGSDDLDPALPFIIKIQPAGLGLPRNYYFEPEYKKYVEAYKQYMSETVKIFEGTKLQSSQFAENTFSYEKRIAEITPDDIDRFHPSEVFKRRFSIRELKIIAPSIKWISLLQKYFQKARLNDNTRVLLAYEYYFRNISNIISTTDNKGLNDYLMWKMISTYAPYLSKDFRIIHYNFNQALNNLPSLNYINDEDRWRFCLETTSNYLGHALSALYVKNKFSTISNKTEKVKQDLIGSIQRTILDNSHSFLWVNDEDDRKLIKMKIKQMEIFVGQPQFNLKPRLSGYYDEYFAGVKFLQNILEAINHKNKKMEMLLNEKNYDYAWPLFAFNIDINYDYAANKLFIPAGILNLPYFDRQAPNVARYGAIGFHIISQMLKAFDLIGLYYNLPDGRLSNNRKFIENYDLNRNLMCLNRKINSVSPKLNKTLSQTYIDLGALHFAWTAYKKAYPEEPKLPSLPLNNDQLFFISFAHTFCSNIKPSTLDSMLETTFQLPDSIRVNTLLSQSELFANVFKCPNEKRVHKEICHLWN